MNSAKRIQQKRIQQNEVSKNEFSKTKSAKRIQQNEFSKTNSAILIHPSFMTVYDRVISVIDPSRHYSIIDVITVLYRRRRRQRQTKKLRKKKVYPSRRQQQQRRYASGYNSCAVDDDIEYTDLVSIYTVHTTVTKLIVWNSVGCSFVLCYNGNNSDN